MFCMKPNYATHNHKIAHVWPTPKGLVFDDKIDRNTLVRKYEVNAVICPEMKPHYITTANNNYFLLYY